MLFIDHDTETSRVRLISRDAFAEVWINYYSRLTSDFGHVDEPHDCALAAGW